MNPDMKYEDICKYVGKLVLDFNSEMEKMSKQYMKGLDERHQLLLEKDRQIKDLKDKVDVLSGNLEIAHQRITELEA